MSTAGVQVPRNAVSSSRRYTSPKSRATRFCMAASSRNGSTFTTGIVSPPWSVRLKPDTTYWHSWGPASAGPLLRVDDFAVLDVVAGRLAARVGGARLRLFVELLGHRVRQPLQLRGRAP